MKFAIMGTGGVGALFGARLAAAGEDVLFIARGAHLAAIKKDGLKIVSEARGDVTIDPCLATDDLANLPNIGPVDYVFITVKLWDTETAIEKIRPLVGPDTTVVSFQNGISRDDTLKAALGKEHIIGGISYVGATIEGPGTIVQKGQVQKLVFGEYGGAARTSRIEALAAACQKADIEVEIPDDIERALWTKFIVLVAMSSLTASTRQCIGPVRENVKTRALLVDVLSEVAAVATASGVKLPADIVQDRLAYLDNLAPDVTASMEYDLRSGNRLELPWLAGTVVELGEKLAVPTPVCRVICGILSPYIDGRKEKTN